MSSRCKLYVSTINQRANHPTQDGQPQLAVTQICFNAVYSPDPTTENHAFWKATPCGTCEIWTSEPYDFELGQSYYVDIEHDEEGTFLLSDRKEQDMTSEYACISFQLACCPTKVTYKNGVEWLEYPPTKTYFKFTVNNPNCFSFFDESKKYKATFIKV